MYHTETPPQYQGQGIARVIVEVQAFSTAHNKRSLQAALDYAQKEHLKVRPTCNYVAHYLNKTDNGAYKTLRLSGSHI